MGDYYRAFGRGCEENYRGLQLRFVNFSAKPLSRKSDFGLRSLDFGDSSQPYGSKDRNNGVYRAQTLMVFWALKPYCLAP